MCVGQVSVATLVARVVSVPLILGPALLFGTPLAAQLSGSLLGTVVDATSGAVLEGVAVSVEGAGTEAFTDSDGRFWIPDLPAGQESLRISTSGYTSVVESIDVYPAETLFLQVQLGRVEATLEELLARARAQPPQSGGAIADVGRRDVSQTSAMDLLANQVPGVTLRRNERTAGAGARVRIRGSSSMLNNDPVIYVDGIRVSDRTGAAQVHILELIPAEDVERIRILRGPAAAAAYTDANSGIILVETRRGGGPEDGDPVR